MGVGEGFKTTVYTRDQLSASEALCSLSCIFSKSSVVIVFIPHLFEDRANSSIVHNILPKLHLAQKYHEMY